ncbi:DUF1003 domain-containing protein [Candidatus Woesearchaeota archaeon]|nr:DUF1003 domain-containing protein [Candidatus Woesearchaeota archaeon]
MKKKGMLDRLLNGRGLLHKRIDKHPIFKEKLTIGQKSADAVSKYAGSWGFIFGFLAFLALWVAVNVYAWVNAWDPYPFILLNLILSCLAALQAPIILMSQNRQAQRDRIDAKYDHAVNRKAEREIQAILKGVETIKRNMRGSKK